MPSLSPRNTAVIETQMSKTYTYGGSKNPPSLNMTFAVISKRSQFFIIGYIPIGTYSLADGRKVMAGNTK
jgi:hypothetical protein